MTVASVCMSIISMLSSATKKVKSTILEFSLKKIKKINSQDLLMIRSFARDPKEEVQKHSYGKNLKKWIKKKFSQKINRSYDDEKCWFVNLIIH